MVHQVLLVNSTILEFVLLADRAALISLKSRVVVITWLLWSLVFHLLSARLQLIGQSISLPDCLHLVPLTTSGRFISSWLLTVFDEFTVYFGFDYFVND